MKHIIFCILALLAFVSCRSDNDPAPEPGRDGGVVDVVTVASQPRRAAQGIDDDAETDDNNDTASIIIDGFDSSSLLYFSQMGVSLPPNFSNMTTEAFPYLYIYRYYRNDDATWEADYNFKTETGRLPFDWDVVKSIGSVGNAFSFYAFYFPVDNTPRFYVEKDQTGGAAQPYSKNNFMKSDIMGAFHATSALYTRMRFNLFHLMTYLKVTLYVPVFDGKTSDDYSNSSYSGFLAGALQGAYVMNAFTDFSIEWYANRSSDVQAPVVEANGTKSNIKMYRHLTDENRIIEDFPIGDYFNGNADVDDTESVREYTFSVLFPTQSFNDNFLCFALRAPDGKMKYYYFSSSQIMSETGNLGLTQGTLQQLYLYLPRKTNETILVGAKILPWKDAVTDMTVTKQ